MKVGWLEKVADVSRSKGELSVVKLMRDHMTQIDAKLTAYEIGSLLRLSPQHVNRILRKLYQEGKVECEVMDRGARTGRLWWWKS